MKFGRKIDNLSLVITPHRMDFLLTYDEGEILEGDWDGSLVVGVVEA